MLLKRLIFLAVLAVCLSGAIADEMLFSGNDDGRWIARGYRQDNADWFDIFRSSPGSPFEPVLQQIKGKLAAVQTVGKTLRVIYDKKSSVIVSEDGSVLTTMNLPGEFMALCESSAEPGGQNELMVLATVKGYPKGLAPAGVQAGTDEWVCLYRSHGLEFQPVAIKGAPEKSADACKAAMAQAGGKIYILLTSEKGAGISSWSPFDDWKKLPSPKETPMDILKIDGGVFLVFPKKVESGTKTELRLAKLSPDGKVGIQLPIVDPETKKALTWDDDVKMALSSLGKEAGICWKDRTTWQFLTTNEKSQAGKAITVDELLRASARLEKVEKVQQFFTIAIISAAFAVMFLLKPYITMPRILTLPAALRPANLFKRAIALIIDLIIIQLPISIAMNYFAISVRGIPRDKFTEMAVEMLTKNSPRLIEACPELIYFAMAFIVIFAVYGTACEMLFGWTVGKKIMGLRVVTDDAAKPPLREAALRNIFKIIALVSASPGAGMMWYLVLLVIVIFVTRYHQRIGDIVARTIVVEAAIPGEQQQPPAPPQN